MPKYPEPPVLIRQPCPTVMSSSYQWDETWIKDRGHLLAPGSGAGLSFFLKKEIT